MDIDAISVLKENILKQIEEIWIANLTLWHKAACFLYPPAINMQPNYLDEIKLFCIARIQDNVYTTSTDPTSVLILEGGSLSPSTPSSASTLHFSFNESNSDQSTTVPSVSNNTNDTFFFSSLLRRSDARTIERPKDEVERYSKEKVEMTEKFDVMEWWQIKPGIYHN